MKTCTLCGETKAFGEFNKHVKGRDGLQPRCRSCCSHYNRAHYLRHRDEVLAAGRAKTLRNQYGVTEEQVAELLCAQGGGCGICGATASGVGQGTLHVDHDHACCPGRRSCGRCVRGLLCQRCNTRVVPVLEAGLVDAGLAYLASCRR